MPKLKHTPGPWALGELLDPGDNTKHVAIIQREGVTQGAVCLVSSVNLFDAQDAANAHLIAAAPELLAALRRLVSAYSYDNIPSVADALREARAALAKAEPEAASAKV